MKITKEDMDNGVRAISSHFDTLLKLHVTNKYDGFGKFLSQETRPMTEEEIEKEEKERLERVAKYELENSPEEIKKALFFRAEKMGIKIDKSIDYEEDYTTVYENVKLCGTAKDLNYILGILNDEIH